MAIPFPTGTTRNSLEAAVGHRGERDAAAVEETKSARLSEVELTDGKQLLALVRANRQTVSHCPDLPAFRCSLCF